MTETRKTYYRGVRQLENEAEFRKLLKREFPDVDADKLDGFSRRRFMQLLGASATLAAAGGCRWEEDHLAVENQRGELRKPGVPQHYATAMELRGVGQPLVMTCYDGRPIKVEGNARHQESQGAASTFAQASVLGLYDPDRSRSPSKRAGDGHTPISWDDVTKAAASVLGRARQKQGEGFAVLARSTSSITVADLKQRLAAALPKSRWFEYEPLSDDNLREGARIAFGAPMRVHYKVAAADVIVCLDSDLLEGHPSAQRHAREFASRRAPEAGAMNRMYVVEGDFSVTGSSADHRLPLRPGLIGAFVQLLESHLGVPGASAGSLASNAKADRFASALANDLKGKKGRSMIAIGPSQPPVVVAHVHRLNEFLGNVGATVTCTAEAERSTHAQSIKDLVAEMNAGRVQSLLILDGNPVYDAPADLAFAAALTKVETSVHLASHVDETSKKCSIHLPLAHFLESWGDARSFDGTLSVVQPCIAPLWGGKSAAEVLALFSGDEITDGYELVRRAFEPALGAADGADKKWRTLVHDGLLENSAFAPVTAAVRGDLPAIAPGDASEMPGNGKLELAFKGCSKVLDGRFSNNAWLQELPDFMTKVVWDNCALIGPATAEALGVENETLVTLKVGGRSLEAPAYVLPGHAPGLVTIALGYGRPNAGVIGGRFEKQDDDAPIVGVDAYTLRTSDAIEFASGLSVEASRREYKFALTQFHHMIDSTGQEGRDERIELLVREGTLSEWKERPDFVREHDEGPPLESLWTEYKWDGEHRWGMSIDLGKCTGCNACVTACQSENNIPIVGREQVSRGRQMHWLRIDRYFTGPIDDPAIATQPLPCQQCENAPCEQVCPVGATQHSKEGLNDMTYNRCIGTRYCSNNCPYKVRRFNFFNYQLHLKDPEREVLKLAFNPEVTVRSRGVMEKCTFCIQRISASRITAKNERRELRDGDITPACAQTCAAQAIVFGDLADQNSRVFKEHTKPRAYALLGQLNSKPRVAYLARVTNPNPELAGA